MGLCLLMRFHPQRHQSIYASARLELPSGIDFEASVRWAGPNSNTGMRSTFLKKTSRGLLLNRLQYTHIKKGDVWEFVLEKSRLDGPAFEQPVRDGRKELQRLFKEIDQILERLDRKLFQSTEGPPTNSRRIEAA